MADERVLSCHGWADRGTKSGTRRSRRVGKVAIRTGRRSVVRLCPANRPFRCVVVAVPGLFDRLPMKDYWTDRLHRRCALNSPRHRGLLGGQLRFFPCNDRIGIQRRSGQLSTPANAAEVVPFNTLAAAVPAEHLNGRTVVVLAHEYLPVRAPTSNRRSRPVAQSGESGRNDRTDYPDERHPRLPRSCPPVDHQGHSHLLQGRPLSTSSPDDYPTGLGSNVL